MSDTTAAPLGGINRGAMIVALGWVFTGLSAITVSLWVYARRRQKMPLGWDVWLMIVAVIVRIAVQIMVTMMLKYRFGKHDVEITPNDAVMILKYTWLMTIPTFICTLFARFSITVLLIKLFGIHKWFRIFLISMLIVLTIITIATFVVLFAQCSPLKALWDLRIVPTRRWDPRVFLYTAYLLNSVYTFSDLVYVLFPVIIIWNLHMPLRRRVGLMLMMCLSLFTMSMSLLRTIWTTTVVHANTGDTDIQYKDSFNVLWGTLEACFVIIMGCIPSIRTLFTSDSRRGSLTSLLSSVLRRVRGSVDKSAGGSTLGSANEAKISEHGKYLTLDPRDESHHVTVSVNGASGSNDDLNGESAQILRTAEWTVTYAHSDETLSVDR